MYTHIHRCRTQGWTKDTEKFLGRYEMGAARFTEIMEVRPSVLFFKIKI